MKVSEIRKNPKNPRRISKAEFEKLKRSITEFPEMMPLSPIIVDENGVVLSGNMRFEALKALGYKDVPEGWVVRADDLTDEQKREFVIKANGHYGEWDFDGLANEWNDLPLIEWGLWIPDISVSDLGEEEIKAPPSDRAVKTCPSCGHEF